MTDSNQGGGAATALQLAADLQTGRLNVSALVEERLAAIEGYDDPTIFTLLTEERARREAEAAAERLAAGRPLSLLDGVPIAWKDLFDLAGEVTTVGSKVLLDSAPAERDAAVVERLKAAGMVCLGRVNMTEFAYSGLGLNPHFGTPRNPLARDVVRIPGGSSSGSGAAVGAGLAPVSIGSDTGGSVRIPAAFNGLVGYKSSHGRYPMEGVYPLSTSLDTLGVLCHSVFDAALVDAAMTGRLAPALERCPAEGLHLIVPNNVVFDKAEPDVIAAFEAALLRLAEIGVTSERRSIPQFDAFFRLNAERGGLITAEAYALHAERLAGPEAALYDQRIVHRLRMGQAQTAADLIAIRDTRARLIEEMAAELGPGCMLAYPTVAHVAPPLAPLLEDDALYIETNMLTLRNTMIGNFLNFCGVTLPCGLDRNGMPVGFLLSAAHGQDEAVLAAALAIEAKVSVGRHAQR